MWESCGGRGETVVSSNLKSKHTSVALALKSQGNVLKIKKCLISRFDLLQGGEQEPSVTGGGASFLVWDAARRPSWEGVLPAGGAWTPLSRLTTF